MIERHLKETGLDPRYLELEVTESSVMKNPESAISTLRELKAMGIKISIDDFGSGYSSLSYLKHLPIDVLKIDQSFVRDLSSNEDSMAIIRAVTGLGSSLGMTTTGEGVETREELDYLRREGCTEAQGYFFSEARPAREVYALLAKQAVNAKAVA